MKRLLLAALTLSLPAAAQQVSTADLDRVLDSLSVHNRMMASVILSHNGQKVYERAIGYAVIDSAQQVKATPATRYRIGSITKTFTATMIMQLVEAGKLTLTTPLSKYFPEIPDATQITVDMMLRHRSGIHNFTDDDAYWTWNTKPKTRAELLAIFAANKPDFQPDAETRYSNTNYVLLGYMLEDITKKSYAQNLKERIAAPLGLKDTRFGGDMDTAHGDAMSYSRGKTWTAREVTDLSITGGAGSIVSTPADVVKFYEALFTGKLVSRSTLSEMTKVSDTFGIGLAMMPFYQRKGYGHTGGIDGFQTSVAYFPGDSLAAAVFSNGADFSLNSVLVAALSTYYKMPVKMPDFRTTEVRPEELPQYTGIYSSEQIPLKLTVKQEDNVLIVQATGQPALRLTPFKKDVFKFDPADVTIEFRPQENALTLLQNGAAYIFKK